MASSKPSMDPQVSVQQSQPKRHRQYTPSSLQTSPTSSSSPASCPFSSSSPQPRFPVKFYSPKISHVADISYPESYLRTPLPQFSFPHLMWHDKAATREVYKVEVPILDEYDSEIAYLDSEETVIESIEGRDEDLGGGSNVWSDRKRDWIEYESWAEQARSKRNREDYACNQHASHKKLRIRT